MSLQVGYMVEATWADGYGLFVIEKADFGACTLKPDSTETLPPVGAAVSFEFGEEGSFYRAEGKVASHGAPGEPDTVEVSLEELHRIQRRQFVRVPDDIRVGISVDETGEYLVCRATNISAGGIEVECDKEIPEDSRCSASIRFPDDKEATQITSRVARMKPLDAYPPKFKIGLEFLILPRDLVDKLVRYVFSRQREMQRGRRMPG